MQSILFEHPLMKVIHISVSHTSAFYIVSELLLLLLFLSQLLDTPMLPQFIVLHISVAQVPQSKIFVNTPGNTLYTCSKLHASLNICFRLSCLILLANFFKLLWLFMYPPCTSTISWQNIYCKAMQWCLKWCKLSADLQWQFVRLVGQSRSIILTYHVHSDDQQASHCY